MSAPAGKAAVAAARIEIARYLSTSPVAHEAAYLGGLLRFSTRVTQAALKMMVDDGHAARARIGRIYFYRLTMAGRASRGADIANYRIRFLVGASVIGEWIREAENAVQAREEARPLLARDYPDAEILGVDLA